MSSHVEMFAAAVVRINLYLVSRGLDSRDNPFSQYLHSSFGTVPPPSCRKAITYTFFPITPSPLADKRAPPTSSSPNTRERRDGCAEKE